MVRKVLIVLSLVGLMSCSDDEETTQDPMAPTDGDTAASVDGALPDVGMGSSAAAAQAGAPSAQGAMGGAVGGAMGAPTGTSDAMKAVNAKVSQAVKNDAAATAMAGESVGGVSKFVNVSHLNVRSGPGVKHKAVAVIPYNTEVTELQVVGNGHWVKIAEGKFVSGKYLSTQKNPGSKK